MTDNGTNAKALVTALLKTLTKEELAAKLAVSVRSVERWRDGTPPRSLAHLRALERLAKEGQT